MAEIPTGTVTFLFSDIEGSTRRWEQQPELMQRAFARQEAILRSAMAGHNGYVYKMIGDAFQVAFASASAALNAALDAQRALNAEAWGEIDPIKVRMALHTGVTEERGDDYVGPLLNRVARLMSAGHGGQVLLTQATYDHLQGKLPEGIVLRGLGERRLKDLIQPEHVYQLVAPDLPSDFPPLKTLDARPNNLPIQVASFVGRQREMSEVKRLFETTRLLTLTGSGGVGKSTLALHVGADWIDQYNYGVWLVELASLADPAMVVQAVASTLGLHEEIGRSLQETLKAYLREKDLLLLLDNCEHLVAACAQLVETLLRHSPGVKILATSREALGIPGEELFQVPPLAVADLDHPPSLSELAQYESIQLFVERAATANPAFALKLENAPAVAQICKRLDGIPLAIELAATRIKILSPQQIASRLDDRFRLLTAGSRTALPHQQTLRALIDWSYSLLSEQESLLFRRLAVFAGGWILEAAETICSGDKIKPYEVLDLLSRLVDKSLVLSEEQYGAMRYHMLETIRQYASDRLRETGEISALNMRHMSYYLDLIDEAEPALYGDQQAIWFKRLELERDNLRAVFDWTQSTGNVLAALHLTAQLAWFYYRRGYFSEGNSQLMKSAAMPGQSQYPGFYAKVLWGLGNFAWLKGDYNEAKSLMEESISFSRQVAEDGKKSLSVSLAFLSVGLMRLGDYFTAHQVAVESLELGQALGDFWVQGIAAYSLGRVALESGDNQNAHLWSQESYSSFRRAGDDWGQAMVLASLGVLAQIRGDFADASSDFEEALTLNKKMGDLWGVTTSLANLGDIARIQGDTARAIEFYQENLENSRQLGNVGDSARALHNLGFVALIQGDRQRALMFFDEGLSLFREIDLKRGLAECLTGFSAIVAITGKFDASACLLAIADSIFDELGALRWPVDQVSYDRIVSTLREQMGDSAYQAAYEGGSDMSFDQAIDYAHKVLE